MQKDAEADVEQFHRELGPFVVAVDETRMPVVFTDAKTPDNFIIFANASFLALTGYTKEDVLGERLASVLGRGSDQEVYRQLLAAFEASSEGPQEIHFLRSDGADAWASMFSSPVRDAQGAVVQHFVSLLDITEHKQAKRYARRLIDELNHRVKNTLATVLGIVRLSFRKSSDPDTIRDAIESRLFALSRSHDLLNRVHWKDVGFADVVHAALEPFGIKNGLGKRIVLKGENIEVSPKIAMALSIALHELATNAVKYGALSNETGAVLLEWALERNPDTQLKVRWQERDGPPVARPVHEGFGSQLIQRGIALELQAVVQLQYPPEGVVCTFYIPTTVSLHG
ncbi:MAG: HWE histidine kinase domain-containing protein [Methylocystis sp.]|uniref:HWE histidine kinase domain-containing protein n=1 Tax=Methylocystis sp. TaxID=1911079 RepID=UPI003DA35E37